MTAKVLTRRMFLKGAALSAVGVAALAACQPKIVEVTKVVEKVVKETIVVAGTPQVVEKTVKETVVVEKVKEVVATAAPKAKITLRYMDISGEQGDFQRYFSRVFEDRNPGITVVNETTGWGDLVKKVAVSVAGDTMADLAFQHGALMLPGLAQKGAWLNLEPLADKAKHNFSIYYPWALETLKQGPKNELVAMPMGVHTGDTGVYWNVQMLKGAGIPEPSTAKTMADLILIWNQIKQKLPGVWPVIPNDAGHWGMEAYARAFKGYIISDDRKKVGFDLKETRETHNWAYNLVQTLKVQPPRTAIEGSHQKMFYAQKLATAVMNPCNVWMGYTKGFRDVFTFGHCVWPGLVGGVPSCDAAVASAKTKYPNECWALLELLAGFDASKWTAINPPHMTPGAVIAAWEDPAVQTENPIYKDWADFWKSKPALGTMPVPANTRLSEFSDLYGNQWGAMLYGDKPYNDANYDAMAKSLQAIMDKPMP